MNNIVNNDYSKLSKSEPLGARIKAWIKSKYPSVKEFSRISGIPYPSLNNWFSGNREPSWQNINHLIDHGFDPMQSIRQIEEGIIENEEAKATQVKPYSVNEEPAPYTSYIEKMFVFVDQMDIEASAGTGAIVSTEYQEDKFAFNRRWITSKGLGNAKLTVIKVKGDSMEDTLSDGEMILVKHQETPIEGKIFVVSNGGELFVKRLRFMRQGWIAVSDNPRYEPIELDETTSFLGIVVSAMRDMD